MKRQLVNYTVDKSVVKQFNEIAKTHSINKSLLIENLILEWIDKTRKLDNNK
ncbi:hypothetical protein HOE22_09890 [Candidatus Woesearchaeota archaeon]|jgi:hypothetical protein|nr:hypothetical protein [Candidatus Woesearchaeota archaeon]MBT4731288.1 hypothetical protein [Candidatus Woesearchaeota archaeon]MBT7558450.1 hypothetical protein [Candidatus Woesearchaeota archaeon]